MEKVLLSRLQFHAQAFSAARQSDQMWVLGEICDRFDELCVVLSTSSLSEEGRAELKAILHQIRSSGEYSQTRIMSSVEKLVQIEYA